VNVVVSEVGGNTRGRVDSDLFLSPSVSYYSIYPTGPNAWLDRLRMEVSGS